MLIHSDGVKDTSLKAEDSTLKAKAQTKDFKIVLEDPRGLQHWNTELNVLVKRRILYTFTQ